MVMLIAIIIPSTYFNKYIRLKCDVPQPIFFEDNHEHLVKSGYGFFFFFFFIIIIFIYQNTDCNVSHTLTNIAGDSTIDLLEVNIYYENR